MYTCVNAKCNLKLSFKAQQKSGVENYLDPNNAISAPGTFDMHFLFPSNLSLPVNCFLKLLSHLL